LFILVAGVTTRATLAEDSIAKPVQADEKNQDLLDALARFRNQDFDGAQKLLKEAVEKDVDLPPALVILAKWYQQANQTMALRVTLERAVVENPTDPESYVAMSDLALREGRYTEAELVLEKATVILESFEKSPRRKELLIPRVQANLAAVAEWREAWEKAETHLTAWLECEPSNAVARQRLGRVLFALGRREEALRQFQSAAESDPNALNADAFMGQLYERAGERVKAQAAMEAAVKTASADLKTRLVVSQWALDTGQVALAQQHADAALSIDPNSLEAKHLRGMVALFERDFKIAEDQFQAVLNQSPASFVASNNLAVALCFQENESKRRRALEYAQVNVRQYPRQAEAYSTMGWILYHLGQRDEADKALRTAASSGTVSPDTAYYLARIEIDRDRKTEARVILESAVKSTGLFLFRKEADDLLDQLATAPVDNKKVATPSETKKPVAAVDTEKPAPPIGKKKSK
jgi:Tfp pilus assembly protein PilF